jgi:predicted  nucleic acid-binding Zn-ribbon protein
MSTVATLVAKFEGDTSGLERSIQRTSGLADGLGASIRRIGEHALGLGLGMAGFQSLERGVGGLKDAIFGMNATLETSTLQFTTLMGDADRAKQHVADLFEFAKKTPFETGPVVEASRMLETFGGAALNTMANITLVGDAAAATSAPIQELAFWVGRAYTMIQGGQPFGEAAMRLQELAVLSAPARQRMEELQKAGASTSEVWKVLQGDLNRFNGAMLAQANTWQGLVSTFIDGAKMTLAQGFEPLFQLGKRALMGLNAAMGSPEFEAAVKRMTDWLGKAIPDAAVRTVEAASGIGSAFANAATIVAQVVGKVAEGFTGLTHIAQSAMTGLASFMSNIAKVIATAMLYISPFTRHSPSLVDQVLEGTRIIEDAWERMASRIGTLSADAARDGIQSIVRLKGALMSLAEATTGRELGAQVFALNRFGGAEAVDSFMAANDALSSMRTEFSQLGSELDDANAALKTQRDELDDLKQAHSDLQRVLQRETRDLSDWKGQLQEIGRTPILELQPLAAQLHTANDELGAATIALLSMKAAAADTIQSFASRTEALNDQIKGTKDSLSALNGKLGDLKDQMSGLLSGPLAEELPFKQKLQGLDDQILGIETKIAQQRARGADPKTYQNLTAQLEKVRAQHEAVRLEMERQIGPLRRQIDAQRDLAQGVGSQSFADRMAGLQQIVPQIASLNKQIADEKTNLRTTEDALSDLTDQQKAALAPIVAQERVVARLKDAQALLRQEYDQTVAPLNAGPAFVPGSGGRSRGSTGHGGPGRATDL